MSRLALTLLALFALAPVLSAQSPAPSPTPSPAAVPAPKLYAVRLTTGPAWDAAKSPNDQTGMREHSANIARIRREGLLVLGARFGDTGLLVLRVPDEPAARALLAPDPTLSSGVFKVQIDVFSPFAHGTTAYLTTPEAVLFRVYLDAYNRHEPDAVATTLAPTVKWLSLDADKLAVEGEGRDAVRTWLTGHFKAQPDVRSEISDLSQNGPYLSFRERALWTAKDGTRRSQVSLGIAEIRDSLIVRVWYYPAVKDPIRP